MTKRKSLIIGGGIALAVIAVSGAATAWTISKNNNTPEKLLYSALQQEEMGSEYAREELLNGDATTKLSSKSYVKGDMETLKAEGTLTCSVEDEAMGSMSLDAKLIQLNEKTYMQYGKLSVANTGDAEYEAALNDYFQQSINGTTIEFAAPDPHYMGYKDKGVAFGILGATSKKLSPEQITEKLKQYNVITINGTTEQKLGNVTTIEYDLSVRRSAYEKFMDAVAPGFPYRTDILNGLFDSDNEEVTLVINKDTKEFISQTYSMANPCIDMFGSIDPTMTSAFPEVVRIKTSMETKNDADKLETPKDVISEADFAALMSAEEEEL